MQTTETAGATQEPAAAEPDPLRAAQERLGPRLEEAKQQLSTINEQVKGFVKAHPGACLVGALALGFVVGRAVSKR